MNGIRKKYLVLIIFFWLSAQSVHAQNSEGVTEQIWLDFIPFFKINDKLEYYGDASFRVTFIENRVYQLVARPSFRYHVNPVLELQGGLGCFYSIVDNYTDQLELRPWQGVRIHWPTIGRIGIKHFFKLEERLLWEMDAGDFDLALRFRYKLGARIPFNESRKYYVSLFGEVFLNEGGESVEIFRNRMRGYFGLGYKRNEDWTVELEYMLQRSRSNEVEGFNVSDHIFRLKVLKNGWVW